MRKKQIGQLSIFFWFLFLMGKIIFGNFVFGKERSDASSQYPKTIPIKKPQEPIQDVFIHTLPPSNFPFPEEIKIINEQLYCHTALGTSAIQWNLNGKTYLWRPDFKLQNSFTLGCRWNEWGIKSKLRQGWDDTQVKDFPESNRVYINLSQLELDYLLFLYKNTLGFYLGLANTSATIEIWGVKGNSSELLSSHSQSGGSISLEMDYFFSTNVFFSLSAETTFKQGRMERIYGLNFGLYDRFSKPKMF